VTPARADASLPTVMSFLGQISTQSGAAQAFRINTLGFSGHGWGVMVAL
jgi:hypothetical protein